MIDLALLLFALALIAFLAHAWLTQRALNAAWAETTYWRNSSEFFARGVDSLTAELREKEREQIPAQLQPAPWLVAQWELPDNELFAEAAE